ncbi:MAG TPA: hypothetical protein VGP07_02650 [Polyangia bacterium]
MGSLVFAVVMLSSGLALSARSIESAASMANEGTSVAFFVGLTICGAGVFLLVRGVARRSARNAQVASRSMSATVDRWRAKDLDGMFGPPARRWGASYGGELGMSANRTEFREAARALLFACDEDPQKAARTRRAVRSACRRSHFRGVVKTAQPTRHRVRMRGLAFS